MTVLTRDAKEQEKKTTTVEKTAAGEPVKKARRTPVRRLKRKRVSGLEKLRQAADRHLGQDAEELAAGIIQRGKDGMLDNAKFLVALAEKKKPEEEPVVVKDTGVQDLIAWLGSETPWKGQQQEGLGEVGEGGVEREGW